MVYKNYIAIEGPDGTGKTTLAAKLAEKFHGEGFHTMVNCQPSKDFAVGKLVRYSYLTGDESIEMLAFQMLIAADARNQNTKLLESNHLQDGGIHIVDRCYMSGLVGGYIDGYDMNVTWDVFKHNSLQIRPGLIVYLKSSKELLQDRISKRNGDDRSIYETPEIIDMNCDTYEMAKEFLITKRHNILTIEIDGLSTNEIVSIVWDYYNGDKYADIWDDGILYKFQSDRMLLNDNPVTTAAIIKAVYRNKGKCPCRQPLEGEDTRCPCTEFINNGKCCCKLFIEEGDKNA